MPGLPAIGNPDGFVPSDSEHSSVPVAIADEPRRKSARRPMAGDETFSLGRYVITGRIASGGMATVYRARLDGEGGFAREFAIKVIHPHLAAASGFKDRFLDEARVASRVSHPNVIATVDSDQDHGYHYLVLELVDGVTLRQLQVNDLHRSTTTEGTRLRPAEAARVVCDAARGLHALHGVVDDAGESLDVVHRDLSPHNLMLDVTGRTVLIDLGLAKAKGQIGHTQTGVLCGKLPYMSPEQSNLAQLDARSDVFSLGSVLFELAVGEPPFGDDHTPGTLERLRHADPDRLARMLVDAEVPRWLSRVVLGCLRLAPQDRFDSAQDLAQALEDAMRSAGIITSEVRQNLARRATSVRDQLGPVQPAEPLPPLILADPTGSHRAVSAETPFLPPWARALGMAAAGAMVVLMGVFAMQFGARNEASSAQPATIPSADTAAPPPAATSTSAPAPAPTPAPASTDSSATVDPLTEDEPTLEPSRKRRSNGPKQRNLSGFKGNPYD